MCREIEGVGGDFLVVKIIIKVLEGLNFRLHISPQLTNLLIQICRALIEVSTLYPCLKTIISSAYPYPVVLLAFIICIAGLKTIFQKSADTTPPCGKPSALEAV